jgi:hypothetical protein
MSATSRKARRDASPARSTACTRVVALAALLMTAWAWPACSAGPPNPRPALAGQPRTADARDPAPTPFHGWDMVDRAVATGAIEHLVVATPIESIGNRFRTYRLLGPRDQPGELLAERTDDGLQMTIRLGRFGLPELEADVLGSVRRALAEAG